MTLLILYSKIFLQTVLCTLLNLQTLILISAFLQNNSNLPSSHHYKKPDAKLSDLTPYHQISLSATLSKIVERILRA